MWWLLAAAAVRSAAARPMGVHLVQSLAARQEAARGEGLWLEVVPMWEARLVLEHLVVAAARLVVVHLVAWLAQWGEGLPVVAELPAAAVQLEAEWKELGQ